MSKDEIVSLQVGAQRLRTNFVTKKNLANLHVSREGPRGCRFRLPNFQTHTLMEKKLEIKSLSKKLRSILSKFYSDLRIGGNSS